MEAETKNGVDAVPGGLLRWPAAMGLAAATVGTFHAGCGRPAWSWLGLAWLGCLFALRRLPTPRHAFYGGLLVGLGCYAPQLAFFWGIFGAAAGVLWLILAFWLALWLLLMQRVEACWGDDAAWWLAPVFWFGLEYFRSELWPLKFTWFIAGSFAPLPAGAGWLRTFGVYGLGALAVWLAAGGVRLQERDRGAWWRRNRMRLAAVLAGLVVAGLAHVRLAQHRPAPPGGVAVAGVQLEFPGFPELLEHLNHLAADEPAAQLVLLSEYTLDGPPPEGLKQWCRRNQRWLVVGGKEPLPDGDFYNTAFVLAPSGEVAFQQAKSVPIQFFRDGRPAKTRRVWESPWGRLGLCICYDLSYTRVVDPLVAQGARALLVPTMDVESWGRYEHELNARQAFLRAAEHGLPVFRVASSGISQLTDERGATLAGAPFPGQGSRVIGRLAWPARAASRPLDRWLAWPAVIVTGLGMIWLACPRGRRSLPKEAPSSAERGAGNPHATPPPGEVLEPVSRSAGARFGRRRR